MARVPVVGSLRALSPDGKVLLYAADRKLYSIRLDGPFAAPAVVLGEHCTHAGFSPDGKWLVYSTLVPTVDRAEVFVKPLAFEGLSKQISVDGGSAPVWRGDGREILYVNGSKIYGVRVRPDGTQISASAPELLFEVRPPAGLTGDSVPLAVTHDGSRILFTQASEGADSKMTYIMSAWERALTP